MSIGTDTAAAAFSVGDPQPTNGALPHDNLGDSTGGGQDTQVAPPAVTSLDRYWADQQAKDQAAYIARLSGTYNPTSLSAGLPMTGTGIGAKIIQAAEHFLGTPYKWGGNGAGGIDCSGLIQAAYKAAGINLPRISFQQANSGKRVSIKALRPGDLVAWDNSSRNPGADHIAIYIGNGEIIEAAQPGTSVRIRKLTKADAAAWGVQMGWS